MYSLLNPDKSSFSDPSGFIDISELPLVLKSLYSCVAKIAVAFRKIANKVVPNTTPNLFSPSLIFFLKKSSNTLINHESYVSGNASCAIIF